MLLLQVVSVIPTACDLLCIYVTTNNPLVHKKQTLFSTVNEFTVRWDSVKNYEKYISAVVLYNPNLLNISE